jgi:hypothetical protein
VIEGAKSVAVSSSCMVWNTTKYFAESVWSVSGHFGRSVKSTLTPSLPLHDQAVRIYVLGSFVVYEVGTTFLAVGLEKGMAGAIYYGKVGRENGEIIGEFVAPWLAKFLENYYGPVPFPITISGTQVSMDDVLKIGMKVNDLVNPLVTSDMVIKVFKQSPSFGTQFSHNNAASEGEKMDSDSFKQIYQMLLMPQVPEIGRYWGGVVGYGIGAAGGFIICGLKGGILSIPRAVVRGLSKGRQYLGEMDQPDDQKPIKSCGQTSPEE